MSTSEIQVVDPTLDPLFNFVVQVAATSINLLKEMKNNVLINDKFSSDVLKKEFLDLAKDFIATSKFSMAKVAEETHTLYESDLASAKHHTKVLLKASNNLGAEAMVQYSSSRMGNLDGAHEALKILIEQYDLLKVSLLRYFALEKEDLNFSSEQHICMDAYKNCIQSQIGLRWTKNQLVANAIERERQGRQPHWSSKQKLKLKKHKLHHQQKQRLKWLEKPKKTMTQQAEAAAAAQHPTCRSFEAERVRKVATADGPSADPRRKSFGGGASTALF
ncbi:hypothetical protein EV2_018386 [Malus domestica]